MLTIGNKLPAFSLNACVSTEAGKEFATITNSDYPGKWLVLFFWPMDFTFVCPTEIEEFGSRNADFQALNAQVLGASIDSKFVHLAWRQNHPGLANLPFPMLSDTTHEFSEELGILVPGMGVDYRATFIVNPSGNIQWVNVNNLDVGRNVDEVLRVLAALQAGGLTPCNWVPGQKTL